MLILLGKVRLGKDVNYKYCQITYVFCQRPQNRLALIIQLKALPKDSNWLEFWKVIPDIVSKIVLSSFQFSIFWSFQEKLILSVGCFYLNGIIRKTVRNRRLKSYQIFEEVKNKNKKIWNLRFTSSLQLISLSSSQF